VKYMIVANFALCLNDYCQKVNCALKKGTSFFPKRRSIQCNKRKKSLFYRFYKIPSPRLFVSCKSLMNLCWLNLSGSSPGLL